MDLTITSEALENNFTIKLDGRLDSNSAASAEKTLSELCEPYPDAAIIIDAENLEYISSAGLRVLLKLKKQHSDIKVINVNNEVYEVFEMTGFLDIINISRRMRKFSVEGCELIGQGGFGKVYRYDGDTIIKVYRPEVSLDYIKRERECSRIAFKNGLPTAIAFDVVLVGDSYGVMYELMDADNLMSTILKHPDQEDTYIEKYAELAKQIHHQEMEGNELQPASEIFRSSMEPLSKWLTAEEIEHYDKMIDLIPHRNTLVHGDFHEKNVLVRNEELELIDMGDISIGHPLVELGCVYSTHIVLSQPVIGVSKEKGKELWEKFVKDYFGDLKPDTKERLEKVLSWIAALRRLPFLCMTANPGEKKELDAFVNSTKQQIFTNEEQLRSDFAALDAELFTN